MDWNYNNNNDWDILIVSKLCVKISTTLKAILIHFW